MAERSSKQLKLKYDFKLNNGGYEESYPHKYDKKSGDCVVRAIAISTEQSYKTVMFDLCEMAVGLGSMPNSSKVYIPYLESKGFKEHKLPKSTRMDSDLIPRDRWVICYVASHLTSVKGNELHDTWDCSWTYSYKNDKPINKIVTRLFYKD